MRVLLWHGWLLSGSGSNIYTAKVAEVLRREGHQVLLVCQENHPERHPFIDAWGSVCGDGVSGLTPSGAARAAGEAVVLRPEIGALLPVFVLDEYEGFEVKRFVDLADRELDSYLDANVAALKGAAAWHRSEAVIAGHALPGPAIARRALGAGTYTAKVHGSDLEYAARIDRRYLNLSREGLEGARFVTGSSGDVLRRAVELVPAIAGRVRTVPPGVDAGRWRHLPRPKALGHVATLLARDPDTALGRPAQAGVAACEALFGRDGEALEKLARSYDQTVPDPDAAVRLRELASFRGPLVGYFGKLIPEKGVERFICALGLMGDGMRGMIVGFGLFREWLSALTIALDRGDAEAARWLSEASPMTVELADVQVRAARGLADRITFTGRLDHRYAPYAVGAMDVLVVPSVLPEAFGMVAAEGAAAGALPLVAGHSGLAEVAAALEEAAGRPGLFSYEPGAGATSRIAAGLARLMALTEEERRQVRAATTAFVSAEWSWERTASRLLAAAS